MQAMVDRPCMIYLHMALGCMGCNQDLHKRKYTAAVLLYADINTDIIYYNMQGVKLRAVGVSVALGLSVRYLVPIPHELNDQVVNSKL